MRSQWRVVHLLAAIVLAVLTILIAVIVLNPITDHRRDPIHEAPRSHELPVGAFARHFDRTPSVNAADRTQPAPFQSCG